MALFGGNQPDALDLIQWDAENRAKAYEGLKRSGDLPALGMVFGLNMLGNSQNMGFGQALGNAGLDALQQHKAIMKARRDAINTDLDRQTTLKRAQEDLNRQDRDYELGLQKWDYQKEQDAIQNQLARQRVAMEGARIAMARDAAAKAEQEAAEAKRYKDVNGRTFYNEDPAANNGMGSWREVQMMDVNGAPILIEPAWDKNDVIYNPETGLLINKQTGETRTVNDPLTGAPVQGSAVRPDVAKFQEESGKKAAAQYDSLQTGSLSAQQTVAQMDELTRILDSGLYTGAGGNIVQSIRKAASALGLSDAEAVANAELMNKISNQMALMARSPDSGMGGMPGAMSDKDREFLKDMQPSLDKSVEGNRLMIEMSRRIAKRQIDIANMANEYVAAHGMLDYGFNQQIAEYARKNPMFAGLARPKVPADTPASKTQGGRASFESFFINR